MTAVAQPVTFDTAMTHLKKLVFKNRIRIKDFIVDFDKLRSGYVHENHFLSALSMAKLDKDLSPAELKTIAEHFTVQRGPSLDMVDYAKFLEDVNIIFGTPVRTGRAPPLEKLHTCANCCETQ
eukprot:357633-Chlamydomonas_euryale.AAC.7